MNLNGSVGTFLKPIEKLCIQKLIGFCPLSSLSLHFGPIVCFRLSHPPHLSSFVLAKFLKKKEKNEQISRQRRSCDHLGNKDRQKGIEVFKRL